MIFEVFMSVPSNGLDVGSVGGIVIPAFRAGAAIEARACIDDVSTEPDF
jgi:hypothetical protein